MDSHIGYGSPNRQGTAAAHGEPLGPEEIRLTKRAYGWPEDAHFLVPDGVREHFTAGVGARGDRPTGSGTRVSRPTGPSTPSSRARSTRCSGASCPRDGTRTCRSSRADPKGVAGREASGKTLNVLAQNIPWLLGGSADLGPSNKTVLTYAGAGDFQAGISGRPELPLRQSASTGWPPS